MKIAVLSDFHFGYGYNTELEGDSFENADEAITKALDVDLILLAGDIFDTRGPKTDVWARAIRVLVKPLVKENPGVKLIQSSKNLKEITKRGLGHIPVIALHGNHERGGKEETNVIDALENAGILIYLHCNSVVFEKEGRKVAIHGMSAVPERFAHSNLSEWNPKPLPDCFNIMMLHQSIDPYVFSPLEPPSLTLSNLPDGFDLIVNGHLHVPRQEKIGDAILIIPGSTVVTQMDRTWGEIKCGFYEVELNGETKINFIGLENSRKLFFKDVELEGNLPVREQIERKIGVALDRKFSKPPLIKVKIIGKEIEVMEQELRDIEKKYSDRAIIRFAKELEMPEIEEKIELLRNLRERKLSVEESGLELLKKNLEELGFGSAFDYDHIFNLLSDGDVDKTFNILIGRQKTITILNEPLSKGRGELERWIKK